MDVSGTRYKDFTIPPRVSVSSLPILWLPPTVQKNAFGILINWLSHLRKLSLGVKGSFSFYVGPAMSWPLIQDVPRLKFHKSQSF